MINEQQKIHLYSEGKNYKLYNGNMLEMLEVIAPNSIDAIVTDPPYELNFMNKGWDRSGIAFQKETWEKCLKALKPGGYLLAFGGSRTFHRIACAIEDAGFEIRDTICWLYGSGFPKSMNIGLAIDKKLGVESELGGVKPGHQDFVNRTTQGHMQFEDGMSGFDRPWMHDEEKREAYHYEKLPTSEEAKRWQGFGTALKPAYEPIIVSRKPCEDTCIDNVMKYGVGGINIDECRIPLEETYVYKETNRKPRENNVFTNETCGFDSTENHTAVANPNGRFPSNVLLTYDETDYDEVCGGMPKSGSGNNGTPYNYAGREYNNKDSSMFNGDKPQAPSNYNDNGSAARYFYCAKASKRDRDEGLDAFETQHVAFSNQGKAELNRGNVDFSGNIDSPLNAFNKVQSAKNTHPTVKPTSLMGYLIRLVTPKGGTVLDPFNGSGSTGKACMYENVDRNAGYKYIGIELTPEYLPISDARIRYAIGDTSPVEYKTPTKPKPVGQFPLFDFGE